MIHRFRMILLLSSLLLILVTSACSGSTPAHKNEGNPKERIPQAATDIEGMLREGPGKYAGDKYDEAKVKAELKRFPENLTAKEAYNLLIFLLAEDYKPLVNKIKNFDTTYDVNPTPDASTSRGGQQPGQEKKLNVEILLDASGSMAGRVSGGVKMDLAKQAVQQFAASLPKEAKVSLRVYGHKGSNSQKDKAVSCASTEVVYPLSPYNENDFKQALGKFKPTGWTPLAASIQEAKNDLQGMVGENVKNVVYIVSDGIETCGGDPVQAAKELHTSDISAVVNIIGFDVDDAGQRALKEVAEAGGGSYATVTNQQELQEQFDREKRRMNDLWDKWYLDNLLKTGDQWLDKYHQIENLVGVDGEFVKLYQKEQERVESAVDYLYELGKISSQEREKLTYDILNKRYEAFWKYSRKWYDALFERNVDERNKTDDEIKEKVDEATGNK